MSTASQRKRNRNNLYRPSFPDQDAGSRRLAVLREAFIWIITGAVVLILAFFLVFAFCLRVPVNNSGMEPQIQSGETVLVNRIAYRLVSPDRQDVVSWYPGGDRNLTALVGRIVAIPGETVQITDGALLIDGVPDVYSTRSGSISDPGLASQIVTLGDDEYFILEDNPDEGEDSRDPYIGPVRESDIIGRVWLALGSGLASSRRIE